MSEDYQSKALSDALDLLERRAIHHQRVPATVPFGLARAVQAYSRQEVRQASRSMAEASERRRRVLLAMGEPGFPAELFIEKIRAQHGYSKAARELDRAKRRSGIAFRALEAAARQRAASSGGLAQRIAAQTRASLQPPPGAEEAVPAGDEDQMLLVDLLSERNPAHAARGDQGR